MNERDNYRRLWGFHPPLRQFLAQVGRSAERQDAKRLGPKDEHAVGAEGDDAPERN